MLKKSSDKDGSFLYSWRQKGGTLWRNVVRNKEVNPTRGAKEFYMCEVRALYQALTQAGCVALKSNEFCEAVDKNENGRILIKHDIHSDLRRTFCFAEMEHDLGVNAVYFAMPEHDLTESYFGSPYMWRGFKRIVEMGHELALHLDLHQLVMRYGDLSTGVRETIEIFRKEGFAIQTANIHGNTRLRRLYGSPKALIRRTDKDTEPLKHKFPMIGSDFRKHYAALSLETLALDHGILNWIDSGFFRAGRDLNVAGNCTDNSGSLRYGMNGRNLLKTAPYSIDSKFTEKLAEYCRETTSVFLLHPQFYELP